MEKEIDPLFTEAGRQVIAELPVPLAIFQLDMQSGDWYVVACSKKVIEFLFGGFKNKEEAIKQGVKSVMHPDDWLSLMQVWEWANRNMGTRAPFFVRIRKGDEFDEKKGDENYFWVGGYLTAKDHHENGVLCYVNFYRMEEIRALNNNMWLNNTATNFLMEDILDTAQSHIFWKDKERRFVGASKSFLEYYGFTSVNEIIGKTDDDIGWNVDPKVFRSDEEAVLKQGRRIIDAQGKCICQGEVRDIIASKCPIYKNGEIVGLVGSFIDVTELTDTQRKLTYLASYDALTKIKNRRSFYNDLESMAANYKVIPSDDFYVILFDLDRFKECNDTYGHETGDKLLSKIAKQIKEELNGEAEVARLGGDEFVCYGHFHGKDTLRRVESKVRVAVERPHPIGEHVVEVGCSLGDAIYSEFKNIDAMINTADTKMYEEKNEKHKDDKKKA